MVQILPENPSFGTQLARGLGSGFSSGLSAALKNSLKLKEEKAGEAFNEKKSKKVAEALIKRGIDPDDAALYASLTAGGQTAFAKDILESRKRGTNDFGGLNSSLSEPQSDAMGEEEEERELSPQETVEQGELLEKKPKPSPHKKFTNDLTQYLSSKDQGLTPAEKVRVGKERYQSGLKVYQEGSQKLRTLGREKQNIEILDKINKSGKLPKGFGRFNIDEEGNLKYPFHASPEAQRYVKTLNEFSSGAKDTFGTRVTNFDLSQYLKRYPTLLNSSEGRDQLLDQMKVVNDINSVYYKNLKKVYDRSGGVRNIDSDVAERFAEELSAPEIDKLVSRFDEVGSKELAKDEDKREEDAYYRLRQTKDFVDYAKDWLKMAASAVGRAR